jgi:UPF0271 protein
MRKRIELNSDMGESFGNYTLHWYEEVMKLINHASVACGFHAGDPLAMGQSVEWCKKYNVVLGAHPGFLDLMGFGRRYMDITADEARAYVTYQVAALKGFAEAVGIKVRTAKPHGALMAWAMESQEHAKSILDGFKTIGPDFGVLAPVSYGSYFHDEIRKSGIRLIGEIYPAHVARILTGGRRLKLPRKYGGEPEKEAQMVLNYIRTGKVAAADGNEIEVDAESVCIHGDDPNAPEVLLAIRGVLEKEGVEIRPAIED